MDDALQTLIDRCFDDPSEQALRELDAAIGRKIRIILASRCGDDPTLAHDAYQTAFVKFIELFRRGDRRDVGAGYLIRIAKNCLIDEMRRTKPWHPIETLLDTLLPGVEVDPQIVWNRRLDLLGAMEDLDHRCRFILEAYYVEGMDAAELARDLGIHANSVHMAIKRCRDGLRILARRV